MASIISAGTTSNTSLNLSGDTSGVLQFQTNGSTTALTISTAQVATFVNDASISGLTVGKGGGAVSSNTAFGVNALTANQAGGTNNTAIGNAALDSNTTGDANTALGQDALQANTTASNNTAVGYQAGYSLTTGGSNTVMGYQAFDAATTASSSTIVGNRAGGAITTGVNNTIIGADAGASLTTGNGNCFIGATGTYASGEVITTGSKNTIIGSYNGNLGGLDIRTASNHIVLSDGDGNPRFYVNNVGKLIAPPVSSYTSTSRIANSVLSMGSNGNGADVHIAMTDSVAYNYYFGGYNGTAYVTTNNSGGVKLALGATSWAADSDERFKNIKAPITNSLNSLATLRTVYGNYKTDTDDINRLFLIAQDVQKVYPEAVDVGMDEDKTLSLRAVDLIPVLVAAIKELNAKVDAQALEIATLKAK